MHKHYLTPEGALHKWKIQYGSTPQLSLEAVKFHRPWRALSRGKWVSLMSHLNPANCPQGNWHYSWL